MRLTVLGAGAVGGVVGALLHRTGLPVTLVARGAHLEKMRADGLYVMTPEWQAHLQIPVSEAVPDDTDVVLLAVKSHQTAQALANVPRHLPICCLQNGVGNEPLVAALGHPTIGAMVWMPTVHLVPGEVRSHGTPGPGAIDIGAYSGEVASWVEKLQAAFELAGIESAVYPDIMALKRTKLIVSIAGAVQAICGTCSEELWRDLMAEATAVFDAAELPYLPIEALTERGLGVAAINGVERPGGPTWQSVKRGLKPETWAKHQMVIELANRHRIDVPLIRRLTNIVFEVDQAGGWSADRLIAAVTGDSAEWDVMPLSGLPAIRNRLGAYLQDYSDDAAHRVVQEVLASALSAHVRGECNEVDMVCSASDLCVTDDRPGLRLNDAVALIDRVGVYVNAPRNRLSSSGLPFANALSDVFAFTSTWQGRRTQIRYHRGTCLGALPVPMSAGTCVELSLDQTLIYGQFQASRIRTQFEQLAALTTLGLTLNGERVSSVSLVEYVQAKTGLMRAPDHVIEGLHDAVQIEACIWFADAAQHLAFVNYAPCADGAFLERIRNLTPHLVVVGIHVRLDHPLFGQPTGGWLTNPEAVDAVDALIGPVLSA